MALATWWYEDGQPEIALPAGMTVEPPEGDFLIASLAGLPTEEVARRRAEGHRPYVISVDGEPAGYGWVATRTCGIGELGFGFYLPAGNRYLWDFATLPAFRGRGIYPALLSEIVRRECPPATRLWIIHAPENLPSGVGINRAGFEPVAELSFDAAGEPSFAPVGGTGRAHAAAELLGLPLVHGELDPCWTCGGCSCDHDHTPGAVHNCACATVPRPGQFRSDLDSGPIVADASGTEAGRIMTGIAIPSAMRNARKAPVALVVFGSLFTGFVAAGVLVMVPFAGARENVISAAILLSFAAGWALLAASSAWFTEQPQRWAAAPAIVMGGAGAGLTAWPGAVTNDLLGWLWPPVFLALVVWMVPRSRGSLHSRASFAFLYPVFGVLFLTALGGAYETVSESFDPGSDAMPGQLIDIGDHRLHIACIGTGSPTVVLEAAMGDFSSTMNAWLAPGIARETRVCTYDRAGRGWSESAGQPEDGTAVATALRTLLDRSGEQAPYVLAGHSAGGIYVLNFAKLYPEEVAGVVLIDSMHPEQYERLPAWPAFYEMFKRASGLLPSVARIGLPRMIALASDTNLPADVRSEQRALSSTPRYYRSLRDEFSELRTAMTQAGQLKSLGSTPLIVLTADKGAMDGWQTLQDDLAGLSSNSVHRHIVDATHASLVADESAAAASTQAILDVVASARMTAAAAR